MVYFKHVAVASLLAFGSLTIAARGETPSLKQIILEIPEATVRGRIEAAYMDGNLDKVEKDLFNYLDEYNFEDSKVEDVHGRKDKAWSIIRKRIDETRAASVNDAAFEPEDEEVVNPDAPEDVSDHIVIQESVAGPDIPPEGEENPVPEEDVQSVTMQFVKTLEDVINELPEDYKIKALEDYKSGNLTKVEEDINDFLKVLDAPGSGLGSAKAFVHEMVVNEMVSDVPGGNSTGEGEKGMDAVGAQGGVPQLIEDESDFVNVIHDIEMLQEEVTDLINEMKDKH